MFVGFAAASTAEDVEAGDKLLDGDDDGARVLDPKGFRTRFRIRFGRLGFVIGAERPLMLYDT